MTVGVVLWYLHAPSHNFTPPHIHTHTHFIHAHAYIHTLHTYTHILHTYTHTSYIHTHMRRGDKERREKERESFTVLIPRYLPSF